MLHDWVYTGETVCVMSDPKSNHFHELYLMEQRYNSGNT